MQLATIGLAADEDVFGVIMGGVLYDVAIVINLIVVNQQIFRQSKASDYLLSGDKQSAQWQQFWVERAWPQEYLRDW